MSLALRHTLFEEGRDIAATVVLADIAGAHGLGDSDAADRSAVLADWREGQRRGVVGSPHFFVDDESFFCPTLEIARVDDRLRITRDTAGFEAFLARTFPAA